MQADLVAIRRRLDAADDRELYRVAHAKEHEYIPEVIALARELLDQRGLDAGSPESMSIAESQRQSELSVLTDERTRRSEQMTMALCAITGIMITLLVTCVLALNGKQRLIRFAWKGCGIGLVVKLGAALLAVAVMALVDWTAGAPAPI